MLPLGLDFMLSFYAAIFFRPWGMKVFVVLFFLLSVVPVVFLSLVFFFLP